MSTEDNNKKFYIILQETRLSQSIDLNDISNNTKINIKYLEAIECGNLDIIPPTYIRLFIKSYAQYLKLDFDELLASYEKEVNPKSNDTFKKSLTNTLNPSINSDKQESSVKIDTKKNQVPEKNNKLTDDWVKKNITRTNAISNSLSSNAVDTRKLSIPKHDTVSNSNNNYIFKEDQKIPTSSLKFSLSEKYFLKPKETISSILIIVVLLSTYFLISYLSKQQTSKNSNIKTVESLLTDEEVLSSKEFNKSKLKYKKTFKLNQYSVNIPYSFMISTNAKTKLNISFDQNGSRIEQCNIIAKKDTLIKLEINETVYFDLWNAQQIEILIANKSIKNYLGKDDYIVRGSFEPKDKYLYLEFYSH